LELPPPGSLVYAKTEPLNFDHPFGMGGDMGLAPAFGVGVGGEHVDLSQMSFFRLQEQLAQAQKEVADLDVELESTNKKLLSRRAEIKKLTEANGRLIGDQTTHKLNLKRAAAAEPDQECLDFWAKHNEELLRSLAELKNKNEGTRVARDVMNKQYGDDLEKGRARLARHKAKRAANKASNMKLELEVIELTETVNALKEEVDAQRHDNFLKLSKQREREQQRIAKEEAEERASADRGEYPAEVVVQQHLIRAQVEFYFSDYNLKRDKRLLEKICKEPQRGYLATDEVLALSRVRQLCNSRHFLFESLERSPYLSMILPAGEQQELQRQRRKRWQQQKQGSKGDQKEEYGAGTAEDGAGQVQMHPLWVGRHNFKAPTEKQFPFRRSVFIYGLRRDADEDYIRAMLSAFGGVSKVHFDHGPDTLDRQIQRKMLDKHRVYKLISLDSAARPMHFHDGESATASARGWHPQMASAPSKEQFECVWCHKHKPAKDGFYADYAAGASVAAMARASASSGVAYRVCLQCAAAKSEEQSAKYDARSKLLADDKRLRELLLGLPPRSVSACKTALCVFASQRQASKCVYVRSRLAYDGAFATHYHHYSKLKKEIALTAKHEQEQAQQEQAQQQAHDI